MTPTPRRPAPEASCRFGPSTAPTNASTTVSTTAATTPLTRVLAHLLLAAFAGGLPTGVAAQGLPAQAPVVNAAGTALRLSIDLPPGEGPTPAVVLAPGQGYHRGLPAMEATARALVAQGVAVFRFDWAYFSAAPRGQPSPGLALELQDLQAVVAAARAHPRVRGQPVLVGGKSLGSLVAWQALAADPGLRGAVLLTPVCSRTQAGAAGPVPEGPANYPGLATETRPTLWVAGDRDPLCATPVLYDFARASARTRVAVVGGDHGFERRDLPPAAAATQHARTLAAVGALSAAFVAEVVDGAGAAQGAAAALNPAASAPAALRP